MWNFCLKNTFLLFTLLFWLVASEATSSFFLFSLNLPQIIYGVILGIFGHEAFSGEFYTVAGNDSWSRLRWEFKEIKIILRDFFNINFICKKCLKFVWHNSIFHSKKPLSSFLKFISMYDELSLRSLGCFSFFFLSTPTSSLIRYFHSSGKTLMNTLLENICFSLLLLSAHCVPDVYFSPCSVS